ncbi:MAG: ECF-type sigma factor [Planctomycetota bacterium]|jgi:RNA polymerase sigma factor (TIGR02999 family)
MGEVTRILSAIEHGQAQASEELLPLVYEELRRLAAQRMSHESPGQSLQPTALVHEAYLRLVDVETAQRWQSRGHFFAAAAEAMRRILIERARRRARLKRGGDRNRIDLDSVDAALSASFDDLLAIEEALDRLAVEDSDAARLVRFHYYGGLSIEESGRLLGLSRTAAYELWCYARAHLRVALQ